MISLALFEPDIAQNTGAIIRLTACMGCPLHIIEPCGFPFSVKALRRSAMDYAAMAELHHHTNWQAFLQSLEGSQTRLLLLTTKASQPYTEFQFRSGDILLFGRETAGVPEAVHQRADSRLFIPMQPGARSLNVALSAAMVTGEAVRQLSPVR